jgi:hypothetical protein
MSYRKHGCTNAPWFRSYEAMIRRASGKHEGKCYRDVDVCPEWRDDPRTFGEWANDNGYEPGLSIDRVNPRLGYSPENCRWVTKAQNVAYSHVTSPRAKGPDGRFVKRAS